jgi:CheY-like chemotaxis protein
MKILVADDEPQVLDVVARILDGAGHHVLTAIDGNEALRRVYETHPDLVLLDIHMPHKDGTTVAQQMRDDPRTRQIPVVFLTGLIRPSEADHRRGDTSHGLFLAKPFVARELLEIVARATGGAGDDAPARPPAG